MMHRFFENSKIFNSSAISLRVFKENFSAHTECSLKRNMSQFSSIHSLTAADIAN